MSRRVITVITAITRDRIVIGELEFLHAKKHFPMLPDDMLLELIERVLKDPTQIFEEQKPHQCSYKENRKWKLFFHDVQHRRYDSPKT